MKKKTPDPDDYTHSAPASARPVWRDSYRTNCGALVDHSLLSAEPTCPTCRRLDAEDDAALASLRDS